MTRTFIALELDLAQQHFLSQHIYQGKQLLPALRWVDPQGIHLTLAFLGELNADELERAVAAAIATAAQSSPFSYHLSGLGAFGTAHAPRVLWMGIAEPSGRLKKVQYTLTRALDQQGLATDQRPFSPHLTLARIKTPLNAEQLLLFQQLLSRPQLTSPEYRVTQLFVMKSELSPVGARYSCLQACSLRQE